MEEYRPFIVFFIISTVMWVIFRGKHYTGEKIQSTAERWNASRRWRLLFGDFREHGTLSIRDTILQGSCYITVLIAFFLLLGPGLSIKAVAILYALQIFSPILIMFIILDIIPRFLKK